MNVQSEIDAIQPARRYFTLKTLLAIFALWFILGVVGGFLAWSVGVTPYLGGMIGMVVAAVAAWILAKMDKAEEARVRREVQAIGWRYQEAKTEQKLRDFRIAEAQQARRAS
ncbi:MAG: hypothetical protein AAF401_01520 [Pseudomonadota bacterium]